MTKLERRSRLLLAAYPAAYRRDRGEEIIGTLLEATPAGRSWPLARDVRGLIMGGLRARAALNRRLTTAENLRIAALAGIASYLAFIAGDYLRVAARNLTEPNVAHLAGWRALAVAVLVGVAVALAWLSSRRAVLMTAVLAAAVAVALTGDWRPLEFGWPVTELACLAALGLLAGRAELPGRRWLRPVALAAALPLVAIFLPGALKFIFALLVFVGIGSVLWIVIDARPAIATAVFLLAFRLPSGIDNLASGAGIAAGVPLLAIVTLVAATAVWRLHRQSAGATNAR
jgi:hypothetical protein